MDCLKQAFALFDRDRDGEINKESSDELILVSTTNHIYGRMRLYPVILILNIRGSVKIQFVLKNIWSGGISKGETLSHYFM